MKQYLITDTFVNFGIGAILELTEKQYESRKHLLKKLSSNKYEVLQTVQFKRGEVVGLEGELDKYLQTKVNPILVHHVDADDLVAAGVAGILEAGKIKSKEKKNDAKV